MVKTGGMACIKCTLFLFNLACVIASLCVIMAVLIIKAKGMTLFADRDEMSMNVIICILGCFVFAVAFFGACASYKENICMLSAYSIMLLVLFVCHVISLIYVSIHHEETDALVKGALRKGLIQQKFDQLGIWDRIQTKWQCCGLDGPKDYDELSADMPPTCCDESTEGECTEAKAFGKGCYTDLFEHLTNVYFGVGALIALAEFTGAVLTIRLLWAVYREGKKGKKKRSPQTSPRDRY